MPTVYLTAQQLARMQRKLDIGSAETVFTDAELDDIYLEASYNFYGAIVIAVEEILMSVAKLHNYTAGQTKENKSEVFDHLLKIHQLALSRSQSSNQVQIVGLRGVPPRNIARPSQTGLRDPKDLSAGSVTSDDGNYGIALGPENDFTNE